jgi:phosphotransferase system  glucose/maltose/N-acetylglucosamine-specific IIC component
MLSKQVMNILVPVLLFIILSPGLLLTIPPLSGGLLKSGQTSVPSVMVHAVVFALVYHLLRKQFAQYY